MFGPESIPVVAPADRVAELMETPGAVAYSPQPFAGGDHYHVVIQPAAEGGATHTAESH
jgi:hypothetical protein